MTYDPDIPDPLFRAEAEAAQKAEDAALEQHLAAQEREDLRQVMSDAVGRRLLYRIVSRSGIDAAACFRGENTNETAFLLGKASLGSWVVQTLLREQPELWIEASREAADFSKVTRDRIRNQTRSAGSR